MRYIIFFFLLLNQLTQAQQHCGYDFTSYVVMHVREDGSSKNIANLKLTLVDSTGTPVINYDNKYSWSHAAQQLTFTENYKIDRTGARIAIDSDDPKSRWFFPYAKDTYLLSVTNEFPADGLAVKIEDVSADPKFQTTIVPLFAYNLYVLCTSQQQEAMQFGRRVNKPIDVVVPRR